MIFRWLTLVYTGCLSADAPFSNISPPEPTVVSVCEGFEHVDTMALGGQFNTVATDGIRLYLADEDAIDVIDIESSEVVTLHPSGEVRDLLIANKRLWVAAGTGGVLSWDPSQPQRPLQRWIGGANIISLTANKEQIWAADSSGRVWVLPESALQNTPAKSVSVDGWPTDLAPWANGVLVFGGSTPLQGVGHDRVGELSVTATDTITNFEILVANGETVYTSRINRVERHSGEGSSSLSLPFNVLAMTAQDDGLFIAGDGGEVRHWALNSDVDTALLNDNLVGFDTRSIEVGGDILLLSGAQHTKWARVHDGTYTLEGALTHDIGDIQAMVNYGDYVAVGTARLDGAGHLLLITLNQGKLAVTAQIKTTAINDLTVFNGFIYGATAQNGIQRWSFDAETSALSGSQVALPGESITSIVLNDEETLTALSNDRGVIWLHRNNPDNAWQEQAGASFYNYLEPSSLTIDQETTAVWFTDNGVVDLFDLSHRASGRLQLSGQPNSTDERCPCLGRTLSSNGITWFMSPSLGIQSANLSQHRVLSTHLMPNGAWDMAESEQLSVVAAGVDGIFSIAKTENGVITPVAQCDLPGDTRRILAQGDLIFTARRGTIEVLRLSP